MTRIVIYVNNEEIADLKPLARQLEKKGGSVIFSAIKFREVVPCVQALTTAKHLRVVQEMMAGTGIPVVLIDEAEAPPPEPEVAAPEAEEPTIPVLVLDAPEPEPAPEVTVAEVVTEDTPGEIMMTVGEDPMAESKSTRARKSN